MPDLDRLRRGGAGQALAIRNFRLYFCGLMVSVSGTWMQTTAQAWLVLKLTNSPVALATVAALQSLPVMLFTLVGGAVADRLSRRKLLIITQSLAAAQALALGTLTATGHVAIWHIYILAVGLGLINTLDGPLRQAFVSELVPRDVLPKAIALNSMAQNLGRILGPTLAGLVIAGLGVPAAFYLNAVTFAGTLIALRLLDVATLYAPKVPTRRDNVFRAIGDGIGYATHQPSIMVLLIAAAFVGMFGQNFTTMIPLVAEYLVHADAAQFGILNSCLGSGSLIAALVLTTRGPPPMRRILAAGAVFGVALIAVSLSRQLWLSGMFFVVVGSAYVSHNASVQTAMQMQAPPEMRGRFASMLHLLGAGSSPIGQLMTGLVAGHVAVWAAVMLNGVMCCVGMATALVYLLRARRNGARFDLAPPQTSSPTP
jgi:MFS family permease